MNVREALGAALALAAVVGVIVLAMIATSLGLALAINIFRACT
jgi:hypothetical protein